MLLYTLSLPKESIVLFAEALRKFLEKANDPTGLKEKQRQKIREAEEDLVLIRRLLGDRGVLMKSVEEVLPLITAKSSVLQGIVELINKHPEEKTKKGNSKVLLEKLQGHLTSYIDFMKTLV